MKKIIDKVKSKSYIIPDNKNVSAIADKFNANLFEVKAILSPTVSAGSERLRFCIHSYNSAEQIQQVLNLLSTFV